MVYILINITGKVVVAMLNAMQFFMFGRALVSWFAPDDDNKLSRFLFTVTEPLVYPIRQLLGRFEFFNNVPIDMSFLFAMVILLFCTTILNGGF